MRLTEIRAVRIACWNNLKINAFSLLITELNYSSLFLSILFLFYSSYSLYSLWNDLIECV